MGGGCGEGVWGLELEGGGWVFGGFFEMEGGFDELFYYGYGELEWVSEWLNFMDGGCVSCFFMKRGCWCLRLIVGEVKVVVGGCCVVVWLVNFF